MKLKKQFSLISLITILMLGFGTVNAQEQNLQKDMKVTGFKPFHTEDGICCSVFMARLTHGSTKHGILVIRN